MQPKAMAEWISVLFDHIVGKYGGGTTLNEFRVMQEITRRSLAGEPSTLSEIVDATSINKSTASRSVCRLVARGYVFEQIDEVDRRVRRIQVTSVFENEVMGDFEMLNDSLNKHLSTEHNQRT